MARHHKHTNPSRLVLLIPSWASRLYVMLAMVLLPWTVYLSLTLPRRHLSDHWDISWTGLDIGLAIALLATGFFAYIRSTWIIIAAASTGSLLLVDAWFDVTTEHSSQDFAQALILAFAFELPLAVMSFYLASHAIRRNAHRGKALQHGAVH